MQKNLFDHNYSRQWPNQNKFPLNEETKGSRVREVLLNDIQNSENFLIITGFTSLSNLVETFGTTDYPQLKQTKIVIGFDVDERVSKKLVNYSLQSEIKEYWLKQGVSIRLCSPIINIIEKIKQGEIFFKTKKRLHAKIYVGDEHAMLGSSNFSKSGLIFQREANIRVSKSVDEKELNQYDAIKQIGENYFELSDDYNNGIIELLQKLLKDATWEEALARAIAEILENKWMKDFDVLYQALINKELWPSQKIGIARAMSVIQDQGNVLLADPTGSGKTKFATTLAFTLFHWLGENGYKDRSNALIIAPKQVVENWENEQTTFNFFNKIESMSKLSIKENKNTYKLQKEIEKVDILLVDEAHNFLNPKSQRSLRIKPKRSAHIILSTATPINKNQNDLLRLIELLDIDNLSDADLDNYIELRKKKNKDADPKHIEKLRSYINQFIVRRTKKDLNKMIEREPDAYKNRNGHSCKYPKTNAETYSTGETEKDKSIATDIHSLLKNVKGINYLQKLNFPTYLTKEEEKKQYLIQRFNSAPALATFEIKSSLRSSHVALYEYLYGTDKACSEFKIESSKSKSGDILTKLKKFKQQLPQKKFPDNWLSIEHHWILDEKRYKEECEKEIYLYEQIGKLCLQLSGKRELQKAKMLVQTSNQYKRIIAFDSTVISLDYFKHLIKKTNTDSDVIVATGQNEKNKRLVRENFAIANKEKDKKLIALCSDAMAEGINLQSARAMVLLDMPSVLRIIEQRIGRLERMDSENKEIYIFWPNDSNEFSLNGDKRVVDTLIATGKLIGNNVDIPESIYKKHFKDGISIENYINAFHEYSADEYEWKGVKDSTQNLYSLIEGKEALITKKDYDEFKDVDTSVKSAVSFIESDSSWSFFAFRGNSARSPKWLFIDEQNKAYTDFSEITNKLKSHLQKNQIQQRRWNEVDTSVEMNNIIKKLRLQEKRLLPEKKKRALNVVEKILLSSEKDFKEKDLIRNLIHLFKPELNESIIDYNKFAENWLAILQPALDEKRNKERRKKVISLRDLTAKDLKLNETILQEIYDSCQVATTLDEMIAACIISIERKNI